MVNEEASYVRGLVVAFLFHGVVLMLSVWSCGRGVLPRFEAKGQKSPTSVENVHSGMIQTQSTFYIFSD